MQVNFYQFLIAIVTTLFSTQPTLVNELTGTFDDDSGLLQNYRNNMDCHWLISTPPGYSKIKIAFEDFTVTSPDALQVYDGNTTGSTFLASLTGNAVPSPILSSPGNSMLVRYVTDGSVTNAGWTAVYSAVTCPDYVVLTNTTGSIEDGSKSYQTASNMNCQWLISPISSFPFQFVRILFQDYQLGVGDSVTLYDGKKLSLNPLRKYIFKLNIFSS